MTIALSEKLKASDVAPEMAGELLYKVTLDTSANTRADYLKGSLYWHIDDTMHRATPYDPNSGRMMHRTKLQGEEPFAA